MPVRYPITAKLCLMLTIAIAVPRSFPKCPFDLGKRGSGSVVMQRCNSGLAQGHATRCHRYRGQTARSAGGEQLRNCSVEDHHGNRVGAVV